MLPHLFKLRLFQSSWLGCILILLSQVAEANVPIRKGWNLISLPIAATTSPVALFEQHTGQFNTIWQWDQTLTDGQGAWRVYPQLAEFELLEQLAPNQGYWINSETNTELTAESGIPLANFTLDDLPSAWSMLGFSQVNDGDSVTPEGFFGLADDIMLWGWNADISSWEVWSPEISQGQLSPTFEGIEFPILSELNQGQGFWINNRSSRHSSNTCVSDESFFAENISPTLQQNCRSCHVEGGFAGSTRLLLKGSTEANYQTDNFATLKVIAAVQSNDTSILLRKPIGLDGHGGGTRFSDSSTEFENFSEMVSRFETPTVCDSPQCISNEAFFTEKIWYPILAQACVVCHNAHGPAYLSRLVLQPDDVAANYDILKEVAGFEVNGTSMFLLKPTAQVVHTGGELITIGSPDYQNMEAMVERFKTPLTCEVSAPPPSPLEDVVYETSAGLLQKAAYTLAGRLPTTEEEQAIASGGMGALDPILDQMMTEDLFYDRLKEIYNNMLLTDKYNRWESAINLLNNYPERDWYRDWIDRDLEDRQIVQVGKDRTLFNRDEVIGNSDMFIFTPPAEGIYTLTLDASQSTDRPILSVEAGDAGIQAAQAGNPFGRTMYLRGSFNNWVSPPPENSAFVHTGDGQFVLSVFLTANQHHLKIADEHWNYDLGVQPGGFDFLRDYTNTAVARAPLELIAHVVRNDRPFTEILTADYMMVTPFSARVYGIADLAFQDTDDPTLVDPNDFQVAQIPGMPHAGLLTSPMFLNRYSTTETNKNRHRASKVFEYFLHTNINGLASRPIDASKIETHNPTSYNPTCTGCHALMDPVAGTFKNWNWAGSYEWETFWYQDMRPPGYSDNIRMPAASSTNSLQWLAQQLASDPRFRISTLHTVYEGFTGQTPVKSPSDISNPTYTQQVAAFNIQEETFKTIDQRFVNNNLNLKELIKGIIYSPAFSVANASALDEDNEVALSEVGMGALLTPEQLDRKIEGVLGYAWQDYPGSSNRPLLSEWEYRILYGGIDSDSIIKRVTDLNGLMSGIQKRMANEMACRVTTYDFAQPDLNSRHLFPHVESIVYTVTQQTLDSLHWVDESILDKVRTLLGQSYNTEGTFWKAIDTALGDDSQDYRWNVVNYAERVAFVPEDESGSGNPAMVEAIKQNIQYLHKRLLREDLAIDDPEIERTYQLFYETWKEGSTHLSEQSVRITEETVNRVDGVPDAIAVKLEALVSNDYVSREVFIEQMETVLGSTDASIYSDEIMNNLDNESETSVRMTSDNLQYISRVSDAVVEKLRTLISETYQPREDFLAMLQTELGSADAEQHQWDIFWNAERRVSSGMHWRCSAYNDLYTGSELATEWRLNQDPQYILRAWRAVLTYLLLDYRFLYE